MNQDQNHYKFINSETDHVIFFLSFPKDEPNPNSLLEKTRQQLAYEKTMYVGDIYYASCFESDFDE